MRIVYFGTSSFAVPALRRLSSQICLVVSQPDRAAGRGLSVQSSEVSRVAAELGLPLARPDRSRSPEFLQLLRDAGPDVLIVAAYGQILSTEVLESASRGGINLHGSLLPKYRGAAPIQRAILEGEIETGVTLMQMDRGMDTGDMIATAKTPIGPDETYGELQHRLAEVAADLIEEWLPRIEKGEYPRTTQDHELATQARKVDRAEGEIKLTESTATAYNRFRAFSPKPGTFIQLKAGPLKLHRVRPSSQGGTAGSVLALTPDLLVALAEGSLELLEVQPANKPRMSGRDWANGMRLRPGDLLPFQIEPSNRS